jgi:hypothetical protein
VQYLSTVQAYNYTKGSVDALFNVSIGFLRANGIEADEKRLEIRRYRAKYFATTSIGGTVELEVTGCKGGFSFGKIAVPNNSIDDAGIAQDSE